jgi:hypothetical protein
MWPSVATKHPGIVVRRTMNHQSEDHPFRRAVIVGGVLGLVAIVATVLWHARTASRVAATATPAAVTAVPGRAELRRIVGAMFAHNGTGPMRGARMLLSPSFIDNHAALERFLDITGAADVRPHVDRVRGRNVDLTVRYALVSDSKVKMLFTRRDTWTFTRGNTGWLLDGIRVNDKTFDGLVYPDGTREKVTASRYDPATGSVAFTMRGRRYAWLPDQRSGWKIVAVSNPPATPRPTPTTIARSKPEPSPSAMVAVQTPSPSTAAPTVSPTPQATLAITPTPRATTSVRPTPRPRSSERVASIGHTVSQPHAAVTRPPTAYRPPDPYANCTDQTIDSVADDASVVTLADGRRYLVDESQRYLASLWEASDEIRLCDPGSGLNAKLIHGDDVVYARHLE